MSSDEYETATERDDRGSPTPRPRSRGSPSRSPPPPCSSEARRRRGNRFEAPELVGESSKEGRRHRHRHRDRERESLTPRPRSRSPSPSTAKRRSRSPSARQHLGANSEERHRRRREGSQDSSDDRHSRHRRRRRERQERREAKEARRAKRRERRAARDARRRHDSPFPRSVFSRDSASPRPGPSRLPDPIFGDDLFAAERHEASLAEERRWSAKLASLLADDVEGGFTEFGTRSGTSSASAGGGGTGMGFGGSAMDDALWEEEMRRAEAVRPSSQRIPKRWRDAARGTMGEERFDDLGSLNEEEYAEFIREGMYRRKHAVEIAAREEAERRASRAEAERKAKRERLRAERAREMARDERERGRRLLERARERWEERWKALLQEGEDKGEIGFRDVPWPVVEDAERLDAENIKRFLFDDAHGTDTDEAEKEAKTTASSRRLRTALLRYHPDRFLSSRHFSRVREGEREKVRGSIDAVAKVLSQLVGERRGA